MQSCKEELKRGKQQDVDTLSSWTSQSRVQAQMRQTLTCWELAVDGALDAGMTGSAAAAPLLLAASCSPASSCPLLAADGCVTELASSSVRSIEADGCMTEVALSSVRAVEAEAGDCVRFVEVEADDCASCSRTRSHATNSRK